MLVGLLASDRLFNCTAFMCAFSCCSVLSYRSPSPGKNFSTRNVMINAAYR
jgi:hypothetical protein